MSALTDSINGAVAAFESIPPAAWANALQAALKDAQTHASIEQEALDIMKAVLPGDAAMIALVQLYLMAGGRPAELSDPVMQAQEAGEDPYAQ